MTSALRGRGFSVQLFTKGRGSKIPPIFADIIYGRSLGELDGRDVDALRLLVKALDLRLLDRRRELLSEAAPVAGVEHELKLPGGGGGRLVASDWRLLLLLLELVLHLLLLLLLVQEAGVVRGLLMGQKSS